MRAARRELIYPVDEQSPFFVRETVDAIIATARDLGSGTLAGPAAASLGEWEPATISDYAGYFDAVAADVDLTWLLATDGSWGAVTSWDRYELVGGTEEFIALLEHRLSETFAQQRKRFLADMRAIARHPHYGRTDWVLPLLVHLYGQGEAAREWTSEID